jgi:hypothetical protein
MKAPIFEVPHCDFLLMHSIELHSWTAPIERWWVCTRECMELYPTGEIAWPTEYTYAMEAQE